MFRIVRGGVVSLIVLSVMFFVAYWMYQHDTGDNKKNIEFIKTHLYNGKVVDLQNELSIKSVKDVYWFYSGHDTITIKYGKMLLKYKTKDFIKDDIQKDLKDIFITVEQNPDTLELTLFFQGKEMTEYVQK